MDFNKCSRCGNFYVSSDDVCPKCKTKDNLEFNKFKTYIEENGLVNDINLLSNQTGISQKNINRFIDYTNSNNLPNKNIEL